MDGRAWSWKLRDGTDSRDWQRYQARLLAVTTRRGFQLEELGHAGGRPLLLASRASGGHDAPRLLIASGFHGEEAAGPWGALDFLDTVDDALLERVSLALLPLVNVTGFEAGRRLNQWGENPNRGYIGSDAAGASREGRMLLANRDRLAWLAADGLLGCHEDILLSHCYVYGLESDPIPGEFSRGLVAVNASFFPLHPDGKVDGCPVRDGIVFNHVDTSFEYWLMCQGVRRAACVETPGQHPIGLRIAAQAALMRFFLEHAVNLLMPSASQD